MAEQHTQTPWAGLTGEAPIMITGGPNEFPIGEIGSIEGTTPIDEANTAFIVLACNSHDALLKQNKIFSHALSYLEWGSPEHAEELLMDLIRQLSEAEATTP